MVEQCPSSAGSVGSEGSGGLGKVSICCPRGDPAGCFAGLISRVLIIAAPGGIVPYYYTVDLYRIRHHLKPSAPYWHPPLPGIPPASTCPSCINQVTFRTESKKTSLIFIQQSLVNLETPGAAESPPCRSSELAVGPCHPALITPACERRCLSARSVFWAAPHCESSTKEPSPLVSRPAASLAHDL